MVVNRGFVIKALECSATNTEIRLPLSGLINFLLLLLLSLLFEQLYFEFILCQISNLRGYKTFFMLHSVEHEILNARKYKNIKKFSFFRLR